MNRVAIKGFNDGVRLTPHGFQLSPHLKYGSHLVLQRARQQIGPPRTTAFPPIKT